MDSTPATSATVAAAPDWSSQRDVLCPLCDYNLRGLSEPRCPECGYAFQWRELLDANVGPHPYLFEHHPRRPIRSFVRTWLGNWLPRRFWRSVAPTQPISVRRLIAYWIVVATITLLGMGGRCTYVALQYQSQMQAARQRFLAGYGNPPDPSKVPYSFGGTLQQVLDAQFPSISHPRYWRYLWRSEGMLVTIVTAGALWPALTMATLLIFIASIARARIKWSHVLRCSVYCCDAFAVMAAVVALLMAQSMSRYVSSYETTRRLAMALLVVAAIVMYRLMVAFSVYLRLRHAAVTVLASQIIVLLTVLVVLFQEFGAYVLLLRF